MLLNNRMLFLIVHYWEVMVDVWPAIVKVTVVTFLQINQRSRLSKSPLIFFLVGYAILNDFIPVWREIHRSKIQPMTS